MPAVKANLDADPNSLGSFLSSILIYLTVLFPLVVVMSLSLQLKRTLTNVTVPHVVFLGALYFGILAAGCAFATLGLWTDPVYAAHDLHPTAFDLFILVHTILYLSLTVGQMRICFESSVLALELSQAAALITVGIHCSWAVPRKLIDAGERAGFAWNRAQIIGAGLDLAVQCSCWSPPVPKLRSGSLRRGKDEHCRSRLHQLRLLSAARGH